MSAIIDFETKGAKRMAHAAAKKTRRPRDHQSPPADDVLNDDERKLVEAFRAVSDIQRRVYLSAIRADVQSHIFRRITTATLTAEAAVSPTPQRGHSDDKNPLDHERML